MRILILGANGQLGTACSQVFKEHTLTQWTREDLDLVKLPDIETKLAEAEPELIINCAAHNQVDKAEHEPGLAYVVNALGPRRVAFYCQTHHIPLVHVSTDYVFGMDGDHSTPFTEEDKPGPLSAYATSKLAGEYFVRNECDQHFVIRTCGLFGPTRLEGKGNFVETMLELAADQKALTVVNDQHCTPTYAFDLAVAISKLIETEAYGLYHATNHGATTWYDFALEIFKCANIDIEVKPITSAQFSRPAKRPGYSLLDCSKLKSVIGTNLPDWQQGLLDYLDLRAQHAPSEP
ncbi:dTDP-4-dehydrorhamnose reductase [Polystyrenella longa]|uniref:dTDP-4-dehydrorhamnose reductase n=1 Tax=Polystyrenella longa TaxID=2528007 RepID=A0A518CJ91_9PLAN|nr:dTDP-4-dehydrorhamnose reductase [Polystyrenella longa]QDU79254.1 dTDP-4-dehydrorhamnose reductase [Polystyrenella longa]